MENEVALIEENQAINETDAALSDNDAVAFLKSLQGVKTATVPLVVEGRCVHKGIRFHVSLSDYNKFINDSQNKQASVTAVAKDFLVNTVDQKDKAILVEALKVPGLMDYVLGQVMPQVTPDVKAILD